MRLIERALVEPARVLPLEHARSEVTSGGVVGLVAQDGRGDQQRHGERQAHEARTAQRTHHEQQRIARQKRHHHQPGLDEHDDEQQRIDPGTIGLHEVGQMHVDVQDEVHQCGSDFHGRGLWAAPRDSKTRGQET